MRARGISLLARSGLAALTNPERFVGSATGKLLFSRPLSQFNPLTNKMTRYKRVILFVRARGIELRAFSVSRTKWAAEDSNLAPFGCKPNALTN